MSIVKFSNVTSLQKLLGTSVGNREDHLVYLGLVDTADVRFNAAVTGTYTGALFLEEMRWGSARPDS